MRNLLLVIVIVSLFASGCFFSRTKLESPIDQELVARIVVGQSTQSDVIDALGAPTDIIFNSKEHDPLRVFAYEYVYNVQKSTGFTIIILTFLESDAKRDHVLVFFDDKGVVSGVGAKFEADDASYGLPFGD